MRARELVPLVALAACISNPQPGERTAERAANDGHGGTVVVKTLDGDEIDGELIAIGPGPYLYVQVAETLGAIPVMRIAQADLYEYQSDGGFFAWGLLGTLSTASHGFFLVLSAPVWIASSSIAAAVESRAPHLEYPGDAIDDFRPWARFPQGLPADVNGAKLIHDDRPRPPQ